MKFIRKEKFAGKLGSDMHDDVLRNKQRVTEQNDVEKRGTIND